MVAVRKASADLASHQSCPIKSPAGAVEGPPQGTSQPHLYQQGLLAPLAVHSITDVFVPHVAILWSHSQAISSCKSFAQQHLTTKVGD